MWVTIKEGYVVYKIKSAVKKIKSQFIDINKLIYKIMPKAVLLYTRGIIKGYRNCLFSPKATLKNI